MGLHVDRKPAGLVLAWRQEIEALKGPLGRVSGHREKAFIVGRLS